MSSISNSVSDYVVPVAPTPVQERLLTSYPDLYFHPGLDAAIVGVVGCGDRVAVCYDWVASITALQRDGAWTADGARSYIENHLTVVDHGPSTPQFLERFSEESSEPLSLTPDAPVDASEGPSRVVRPLVHQNASESALAYVPNLRFGSWAFCSYCGEVPVGVDHCVPWNTLARLGQTRSNNVGLTTYACQLCNSKLNDRVFDTFEDRVAHMTRVFSRKARKATAWDRAEAARELRGSLKRHVLAKCDDKEVYQRQAAWPTHPDFLDMLADMRARIVGNSDALSDKELDFLRGYFNL